MHIVIIANGFQKDYIRNLVNSLAGVVDRLDFIASDLYSKDEFDAGIHYENLRGSHDEDAGFFEKIRRIILYYVRLINYLKKAKPDAVHIQWIRFSFLDGIVFHSILRLTGQKLIYTAHDALPHDRENFVNRILFFIVYRICNIVIVHTSYLKQRIVNEFSISADKIKIVKHGVYEIKHHYTQEESRSKIGIDKSDHVFLFFGYIKPYKGIDLLLDAFHQLEKSQKNISLLIAGKIWDPFRDECMQLLSHFASEKHIKKLGFIPDDEVSHYFYASDVTVMPYQEASQSGVMFMSYAHGVPVIVPNIGGFADDLIPGKTGLLFKVSDIDSLKDKMKESIVLFEKNKNQIEKDIKKFAWDNYSWDKTSLDLKDIYASLSS